MLILDVAWKGLYSCTKEVKTHVTWRE